MVVGRLTTQRGGEIVYLKDGNRGSELTTFGT